MRKEVILCDRCGCETESNNKLMINTGASEDFCKSCSATINAVIKTVLSSAGMGASGELKSLHLPTAKTTADAATEPPAPKKMRPGAKASLEKPSEPTVPFQTLSVRAVGNADSKVKDIIAYVTVKGEVVVGSPPEMNNVSILWDSTNMLWDVVADLYLMGHPSSALEYVSSKAGDIYAYANATGLFVDIKDKKVTIECNGRKGIGETVAVALGKLGSSLGVPHKKATFSIARKF